MFARIDERIERLRLQVRPATVPEQRREVGRAEQGRRLARAETVADALGYWPTVTEGFAGLVAGRATDRAVGGKARIEEEFLAKPDLVGGWRRAFRQAERVCGAGARHGADQSKQNQRTTPSIQVLIDV